MFRLTTRRWLAIVAAAALLLSACHASGPQAGLFVRIGVWCAGAVRNDGAGRYRYGKGEVGSPLYQAGIWRRGSSGFLVAGVEWRDGKVVIRSGRADYIVAW